MPTFERIGMLPFETKSFDAETGTFVGLASTPQIDRMNEIVSPDAMREAAERYMRNPVITWMHDTKEPIGKGLSVEVTDAGTILQGYITDKTEAGRKARGLLADGIVRSMSIGFNPYSRSYGKSEDGSPDYEMAGDVLMWKRIDWMETAICAIPCNPGATISLAKSLDLAMEKPQVKSAEDAEQERFLSDLDRLTGAAQAIENITRHWAKECRVISGDYLARIADVRERLTGLLQPHATPDEADAPQGALSLPEPEMLELPPVA